MPRRRHDDGGSHFDAAGPPCSVDRAHQRIGTAIVVREVVLGKPHDVEARRLRARDLLDGVAIDLGQGFESSGRNNGTLKPNRIATPCWTSARRIPGTRCGGRLNLLHGPALPGEPRPADCV